jgi:hypothetical protein
MLKSVSSITNAIGALNFKGTWDANANSPALASSVGTKGDYYVVGTAGTTNLNGISNWGVGDWATYNGSVWQRVEGGADLNGVNLTVSGTSLLSGNTGVGGDTTGVVAGVTVTSKFCVKNEGANPVAGFVHVNDTTANSGSNTFACRSRGTLAAPTVVQNGDSLWNMYIAGNDGTDLALAAEIRVEVDGVPGSNDMPGRILLRTTPDGSQAPVDAVKIDSAQNVTVSAGNLVIGTSGKGIDFSATGQAAGMTSELLADYEEGTWTPAFTPATGAFTTMTYSAASGRYVKVGRYVFLNASLTTSNVDVTGASGNLIITGIPFVPVTASFSGMVGANDRWNLASDVLTPRLYANTSSQILMQKNTMNAASALLVQVSDLQTGAGAFRNEIYFGISYISQ